MKILPVMSTALLALTLVLSTTVGLLTPYITAALLAVTLLGLLISGRVRAAYADDLSRSFLVIFIGLLLLFCLSMQSWRDPLSAINFGMLPLTGPAVWLLARHPVQLKPIHIAMMAALGVGITLLMMAVMQFAGSLRPTAVNLGPIRTANAALALAVVATAGSLVSGNRKGMLLALSLPAAVAIVAISQSRGPVISVLPLFALTMFVFWRRWSKQFGWRLFAAMITLGLLASAAVYFASGDRLMRLPGVIQGLLGGEGQIDGSTRTRLAFYEAGWRAFLQSPWIGHGWANMMKSAASVIDPEFLEEARRHRHLHNDVIDFAAAGGIVGIGLYALIIAAPVMAAWRSARDEFRAARLYATSGISIVYFFGGMTDLMFGQEFQGALYVMLNAAVLTCMKASLGSRSDGGLAAGSKST